MNPLSIPFSQNVLIFKRLKYIILCSTFITPRNINKK